MTPKTKPLPVYTTRGDVGAFLVYPNLFNPAGEWIGVVTANREVFSVLGIYVGKLSNPFRVLRRRSDEFDHSRITPPEPPGRIYPPATVPLAPMMPELSFDTIDVLHDEPERLHPLDTGDMREDMQ
jgi:hypothetical protein